ncbi:MAG: insulinase family protein [Firmicutes bacterium]|nr:insulinase family protein [Bacillota bacterium]
MHKLHTFDNGLRLVVKPINTLRSVTIGIWVGVGSANEADDVNGISHYIEHLMFKGTKTRTAFEIADTIDSLGGQINAFTSKEATCYFVRCIDEHKEKAFDILSDILINSTYEKDAMEKEKGVVLEEIKMVEDTPDEVCFELLASAYFKGHTLAQTILGPAKNIKKFTKKHITDFTKVHYNAKNIVISVVGNVNFEDAKNLTEQYFAHYLKPFDNTYNAAQVEHTTKPLFLSREKDIEQAHIAFAFPSTSFTHKLHNAISIFNNVLGAGMSSRLFQKIREELGLAYSIFSSPSAFSKNGMFCVYVGTSPTTAKKAVQAIKSELERFKKESITDLELARGKELIKGALIMSQESTQASMNIYGRYVLFRNELFNIDKRIEEINAVTHDDIKQAVSHCLDFTNASASYVGKKPFDVLDIISKG